MKKIFLMLVFINGTLEEKTDNAVRRTIPGFSLKLANKINMLEKGASKALQNHFIVKNTLLGTCRSRSQGTQCCPGQDWNCQPPNSGCSCDEHCTKLGDCCPDYVDTCAHMIQGDPGKCHQAATGRINGDPHYHTFDMQMIHFQGKCSYILSKNCKAGPVDFQVVAKNENRYGNNDMSWTKHIFIKYKNIKIEIKKNKIIELNGDRIYTPYALADGTLVDKNGMYISIKTYFGIDVLYDGNGNAEVKATCEWFGKLCGLLGNYNRDPEDDFTGSDGDKYDDKSVSAFGESWRHWDGSPGCELNNLSVLPRTIKWIKWVENLRNRPNADLPTCTEEQFSAAVKQCKIIADQRGVFSPCHGKVSRGPFFENCVWDQCATKLDTSVLCESVAAYGKACSEVSRPISWRSDTFCPFSCPAHAHYDHCGPMCVNSCKEPATEEKCDSELCVEGCFCDTGFIWDGLRCINKHDCGCVNGDVSHQIGDVYMKKNCMKKCKCTGVNTEQCTEKGCRSNQECSANKSEINSNKEPIYSCIKSQNIKGQTGIHVDMITQESKLGQRSKNKNFSSHLASGKKNAGPKVKFPDCITPHKWNPTIVKPDWIPPNSCCGQKPYNDLQFTCCNNTALFDENEEKCCSKNGVVVKKQEKCD